MIIDQLVRDKPAREDTKFEFGPFGEIIFPYHSMGAIDSLNLFDYNELLIFSFYWANRRKYRRVIDAGANIGLHSIVLSRCGYMVLAYEPDPLHYEILQENLALNQCNRVSPIRAAISDRANEEVFVRVLGNTTANHISGSKIKPYGELEYVIVRTVDVAPLMGWADLIKLDIEGHEKDVLLATNKNQWRHTDALVEVENEDNAIAIYEHLMSLGVNLYSQKVEWQQVQKVEDMPFNYKEGTLFIGKERPLFDEAI